MKMPSRVQIVTVAIVGAFVATGAVWAQQAGFNRVMLQDQDLSTAGKHVVQARAEFQPGVASGRHTHPGEEAGYVLEGQVEVSIEGKPALVLKAGEGDLFGPGAAADGVLRFEDEDGESFPGEGDRGGESVGAGTDDDGVHHARWRFTGGATY